MDTERPESLPPPVVPGGLADWPIDVYTPRPPRVQKFRHNYRKHLILFGLTFLTTTFAEGFLPIWEFIAAGVHNLGLPLWGFLHLVDADAVPILLQGSPLRGFTFETFQIGLGMSIPLLTILSAHEFGHYFACRVHDVDATLPFYLPAPVPVTGTFGAVIRIREAFPSTRALFDIGVAGPIAGFIALLPFLYFGVANAEVVPFNETSGGLILGEPLLFRLVAMLHFGTLPEGHTLLVHGMATAAWWGMLATALNLMPFGQLDGGHLSYAVLGRRAAYISMATLGAVLVLTTLSSSWTVTSVMMFTMAIFLGFHHPRVGDEGTPVGPVRVTIALLTVAIFILCFTPVPIVIFK